MRAVAIYARVSSEHEAQLYALDNQLQYYDDIMSKHPDWKLFDKYIDEGKTGTSIKKRANFLRMMDDAREGCFDLIITREVSRFARNTVDALKATRELKALGVEVWFVEDNIRTMNDIDGELRLTIMASLAQNESKKVSDRVKAGQAVSFKKGVPYGSGNILGYDKLPDHGPYVINEEQAKAVRLIFDLYLKGNGVSVIKSELEKRGYKTASGKTVWDSIIITRTLKNSFYCGIVTYRKSYVNDYLEHTTCINKGEVEQVIVRGNHEPIVTEEEYNKVQEIMSLRSKNQGGYYRRDNRRSVDNYWETKLVCGCCGERYNRLNYQSTQDGKRQYGFQCRSSMKTGSLRTRRHRGLPLDGVCHSVMFPQWRLDCAAYYIFTELVAIGDSTTFDDGVVPQSLIERYVSKVKVYPDKLVFYLNKELLEDKTGKSMVLDKEYVVEYFHSHGIYKNARYCSKIELEVLVG